MIEANYKISFTSGAALVYQTKLVAEKYLELVSWKDTQLVIKEDNLLQARTASTLRKVYGEVSRRLKHLDDNALSLVLEDEQTAQQVIWLSICRQYRLIFDFAVEVLSEHYDKHRFQLYPEDYDAFLNEKSEWHDNLFNLTQSTRYKSKQVVFKMMQECGITNEKKELLKQTLSNEVKNILMPEELRIFPGADNE